MSKNLKNSLLYLIPSISGIILPLLTMPFFTRILKVEEYGILALCQAYAIFINSISNFGMNISFERNFFEVEENEKVVLLYTNLIFVIGTYLLFGVLTYLFSDRLLIFLKIPDSYRNTLLLAYFATGMTSLKSFYLIYFKNTQDPKRFVWYTLDESLIGFFLSIFFIIYLKIGIVGMVSSQLIASLIVFLILSRTFILKFKFSFNYDFLKESLKISLPLTPRLFFGIIGSQFDKYILGSMTSLENVGIYSIAQKIATVVFTIITAIQNVWAPVVYKLMFSRRVDEKDKVGSYLTSFYFISIFLALFIPLFSEEILILLAPKEYYGATQIIILLSILYASYFFGKQNQLIFAKKTHLISIITLSGIALNLLFNYIFVMFFGLIGVGFGTLISGLLSGLLGYVIAQKYYKIEWNNFEIITISIFYIASITLLFVFNYIELRYILKFTYKIIIILLFILFGIKLKLITKHHFGIISFTTKNKKK